MYRDHVAKLNRKAKKKKNEIIYAVQINNIIFFETLFEYNKISSQQVQFPGKWMEGVGVDFFPDHLDWIWIQESLLLIKLYMNMTPVQIGLILNSKTDENTRNYTQIFFYQNPIYQILMWIISTSILLWTLNLNLNNLI